MARTGSGLRAIASVSVCASDWLRPASRCARRVSTSLATASSASTTALTAAKAPSAGCTNQRATSAMGSQGTSNSAAIAGPVSACRSCASSRRPEAPAPGWRAAAATTGSARICSKREAVRASRLLRTISNAPSAARATTAIRVSSTSVSTRPLPSTRS